MLLVINGCYGGISLSGDAIVFLNRKDPYDLPDRNDKKFIDCVQMLGRRANGNFARMKIVEIPDNATDYKISEYDGLESVIYVLDGKIYQVW